MSAPSHSKGPPPSPAPNPEGPTIRLLRRAVGAVFVLGLIGTATELILLEHVEDPWQWTPLVLIGLCWAVLLWRVLGGGAGALRAFQGLMVLFLAAGALGLVLHYRGNVEFELEMYPSRKGFELFWEALKGATPALAPGMMIQLGLLGLASTLRHPLLSSDSSNGDRS